MEWNKKILLSIILSVFLINIVSAREITCSDNPFNLWKFDEGNGTITYESCYNYSANFYGGMEWGEGVYGNATNFNGFDSYIDAGNSFQQNLTEFSFSLWTNMSYRVAYQSLFQRGNYYTDEFLEALQLNEGDNSYFVFMSANTIGVKSVDDGLWHNIIGTFNGSSGEVKLYIDGILFSSVTTAQTEIASTTNPLYFGVNYANGYILNGTLDDVAFFDRTLTISEITDFYNPLSVFNCSAQNSSIMTLYISSYPYLDLNTSYNLDVVLLTDGLSNNFTDLGINILNSTGGDFSFNFTWNETQQLYELNGLSFYEIGNYPFTIFPYTPCKINNITGTFKVYNPYFLTVKLLDEDNLSSLNLKYAVVLAEPTNINFTNEFVESFMYPLTYIKNPVFHANYSIDRAVIKLYDTGSYRIRVLNGDIRFNSTFSEPEIIDSYGINSYLGTVTTNGTNQTVTYAVGDKQLHQWFWAFNWILIIAIVFSIIIGVFLLFIVPQQPLLSLIFSFTMVISLCILRIVVWVYIG